MQRGALFGSANGKSHIDLQNKKGKPIMIVIGLPW
jgi:hypothetical protein